MATDTKTLEEDLVGFSPEERSRDAFTSSVIDLGFNSLNLVNYRVTSRSDFTATSQEDAKVRIGEQLDETGFLEPEPIERTIAVLSRFRELVDLEGSRYILPVATSAVREAANKEDFLEVARRKTGFAFRILSEEEEALLSYFGATSALRIPTSVFFDLGGGSIAVVYAQDYKIKRVLCLPLGARRLTYLYGREDGTFVGKSYEKMKEHILELLPDRSELKVSSDACLVGVGGTARAMVRYHQQTTEYPLEKIHNYSMSYDDVNWVSQRFLKMSKSKLRSIPSVGQARSETMVAGSCVVRLLMKKLGLQTITTSSHGLREGTLSLFLHDHRWFSARRFEPAMIERHLGSVGTFWQSNWERNVSELYSGKLISAYEYSLLSQSKYLMRDRIGTLNLRDLFFQLMYVDSPITHPDQLKVSIAIIGSISGKYAGRLMDEYSSSPLMQRRDKRRSIARLSATLRLLDALDKINGGCVVSPERDGQVKLRISSPGQAPRLVLADVLEMLRDELEIGLSYSLSTPSGSGGSLLAPSGGEKSNGEADGLIEGGEG